MNISFFVSGTPVTQGSMRALTLPGRRFPVVMHVKSKELKQWQETIRSAAHFLAASKSWDTGIDNPFSVRMTFTLPRPAKHFRSGRFSDLLRTDAPMHPTRRQADLDKLVRAVLDALTGTLWEDDSQVTKLSAEKYYAHAGTPQGLQLEILEAHSDE